MKHALGERVAIAALSISLATVWYLCVGDIDLNLADEGFLWHGVQRTLEGEVPKRDFQAYDPGRYYLCAAWCGLFGDGILSLRAALAGVQAVGVFFGLCVLRRVVAFPWLLPFGAVLLGWMFPQHKVFEPAYAMIAVWACVRLVERPSTARHLAAGVVVGLGGCVGLNLALYGGLGAGLVSVYLMWKSVAWKGTDEGPVRRLGALFAGVLVGYLPVLGMCAFVPGYAASFAESIASIAKAGTNVPLPYPWPWTVDLSGLTGWALVNRVAVSVAFLLPVIAFPLGLWIAVRTRAEDLSSRAVPIASTLVGLVFVHHVSVRSDSAHLAQILAPVLMLLLAAPRLLAGSTRLAWTAISWAGIVLVSVLSIHDTHPSLVAIHAWRPPFKLREYDVAGDTLRVTPWTYNVVRRFMVVTRTHVPDGAPMLIAPYSPTFYPASHRSSPVYTSYFLWTAERAEEERMIEDLTLNGVDWAWIILGGMDGDRERTLDRTHPLLWRHLTEVFEPVSDKRLLSGQYLLRRRR